MVTTTPRTGVRSTLLSVLAVGFVSIVCGTVLAHLLKVTDTPGPDWAEWGIQAAALCAGMALLAYSRHRSRRARRPADRDGRTAGRPRR